MRLTLSRPVGIVATGLLLSFSSVAVAQFRVPPAPVNPPTAQTQAVVQPATPPQYVPVQAPVAAVPPYGYGGYPVQQTRANGYLTGVASLMDATGNYQIQQQQANLAQEDVRRANLQTQRMINDEKRYEYDRMIKSNQVVSMEAQAKLDRSRNNPQATGIWSGDVLNDLLLAIQKTEQETGLRGPAIPLNPASLQRINVSTGTTYGSIGIFRTVPVRWPVAMQDDLFKADRDKIDSLTAAAVKSVATGNPDGKAIRALGAAVDELKDHVGAAAKDISPTEYIKAMRYTNQLREGVKTLADPAATNFLNGTWAAQGNNMTELVAYMSANGLRFAPANEGDEAFYSALYNSVRAYDAGLVRITSSYQTSAPPPPPR